MLIEKSELDITKLSLAKVTDQYLLYLSGLEQKSPDDLSEFLIIAAKLIQIKSEYLLPRPIELPEQEEDLGQALANQLRIYREIKKAALWLSQRNDSHLRSYLNTKSNYQIVTKVDMTGLELSDLVNAYLTIFEQPKEIAALGTVITIPKITIRRKIQSILDMLTQYKSTSFNQILNFDYSRINTIVAFLALLELIKQDFVNIQQTSLFSEIFINAKSEMKIDGDVDLSLDD
jgi:segregation and condensation protein A